MQPTRAPKINARYLLLSTAITIFLTSSALSPVEADAASGPAAAVFTVDDYRASSKARVLDSGGEFSTLGRTLLTDDASGQSAIADVSLFSGLSGAAPAMWAASSGFVDISWAAIDRVSRYVVFRDEVLIADSKFTSYRDIDVKPGQIIHYRIVASAPDGSGRTWGMVAVVPASAPSQRLALESEFAAQAATSALYSSAVIQYQTFIPQPKIDAPLLGCTYNDPYDYGGDNRGYLPSGYPFKTRLQATVDFTDSGSVSYSRSVGTTRVYSSTGVLVNQATASSSGMTVARLAGSTASTVDTRWNVDVRNPFCSAGSIAAVFTLTVTRSGSWAIISGSHKQMPNHEIYIHSNVGGWVTIYRRTYASVFCLINGACSNASMSGFVGVY
jgi:hypothetical protein